MAAWSKAWVCGLSLAGIAGSNSSRGMGVCRECCPLSGVGLCNGPITRSVMSECSVSECDRATLTVSEPWPIRCSRTVKKEESKICTSQIVIQ